MIDGDTGKHLSHSDMMIGVMNNERDDLLTRYTNIQQAIETLTAIRDEIERVIDHDKPSVGDIRRNGEIAPSPDTNELRKMTVCENRDEDNYNSCKGCKL